jgi:hypothetical protein
MSSVTEEPALFGQSRHSPERKTRHEHHGSTAGDASTPLLWSRAAALGGARFSGRPPSTKLIVAVALLVVLIEGYRLALSVTAGRGLTRLPPHTANGPFLPATLNAPFSTPAWVEHAVVRVRGAPLASDRHRLTGRAAATARAVRQIFVSR